MRAARFLAHLDRAVRPTYNLYGSERRVIRLVGSTRAFRKERPIFLRYGSRTIPILAGSFLDAATHNTGISLWK